MRKIVINSQERAVSSDINRLQSFAVRDATEALRFEFLSRVAGPTNPSAEFYPAAIASPLFANILGGLLVRPQGSTFAVNVDAGAVVLLDPTNAGAEDSKATFVSDAGTTGLAFTANASGQVRIDVVECQLNATPDIVSDNRDIFDEETGLFSASTVTKEIGARLAYRIRAGTPGAGFPGTASGWLPLCVAKIPSGASIVDTCTFWDVRPMAADRANPLRGDTQAAATVGLRELSGSVVRVDATHANFKGKYRASIDGRDIGGSIIGGFGTYDTSQFNVADAANQDTGTIAEPINANVFVYACCPFGLPRWAQYSPTGLLPGPTSGVLVVSQTVPDASGDGRPSAAVAMPSATGLGGSTTRAACILVMHGQRPFSGTTWQFPELSIQDRVATYGGSTVPSLSSSTISSGKYQFNPANTFWPPNVKELYVTCGTTVFTLATASAISGTMQCYVHDGVSGDQLGKTEIQLVNITNASGSGVGVSTNGDFHLVLPDNGANPVMPLLVEWAHGATSLYGTAPTLTNASMSVRGWKL